MSSGKSCSQLSDELEPLAADSNQFKKLINENKAKCANEPRFLIQQAYLLDQNREQKSALQVLDKSIKIDPYEAEAYILRGSINLGLGKYEKSLSDYNTALKISPSSAESAFGKANALTWLNRHEDSLIWYDKAIKLEPSMARAYRERGIEKAVAMKNYSAGVEDLNKAIQLDSSNSRAYQYRAWMKAWTNGISASCPDLKKAKQFGATEAITDDSTMSIDTAIRSFCS